MGISIVYCTNLRSNIRPKNEFANLWNSESRFDVGGANEYSSCQQKSVFVYFSKLRIYNCIIVSQIQDNMHKEFTRTTNVFEVDTCMKFGVYAWFP